MNFTHRGGGLITLERTLSPSVSCLNGTLYSSETCPQGHSTLGYNVGGGGYLEEVLTIT